MIKRSFRTRFLRAATALAVGGSAFQLGGCDPEVRNTLLSGLETTTQSLLSVLTSAFFLTLQDDDDADSGLTTTP